MLKNEMTRVVHFEIVAENPEKIKEFYEKVFNWKFQKMNGDYWMIDTGEGGGINGGMVKKETSQQVQIDTIDVDNIDEYINKIKNNGGKILMEKRAIPRVGWLCNFKDAEGNIFSIMQRDEKAR